MEIKKSRWSEVNVSANKANRKNSTSKELPYKFSPHKDYSRSSDKLF